MNITKRQNNKVTIYIKDAELTKMKYYKTIYEQRYRVELSMSNLIQLLTNNKLTIDDLISNIAKESSNENKI